MEATSEVVIVDAIRTPVGRRNGSLKDVHPVDLGAHVLAELIRRAGIDPAIVDDVIFGCVTQIGEQASNIGRNSWLRAGFPYTTPASTVTRACGSSQAALHFAASLIKSGAIEIAIAGGVESMTRVFRWGRRPPHHWEVYRTRPDSQSLMGWYHRGFPPN